MSTRRQKTKSRISTIWRRKKMQKKKTFFFFWL